MLGHLQDKYTNTMYKHVLSKRTLRVKNMKHKAAARLSAAHKLYQMLGMMKHPEREDESVHESQMEIPKKNKNLRIPLLECISERTSKSVSFHF